MKKHLLATTALIFICSSSAWAQNPTCPTRPAGDTSNACASTAFVQGAIGGNTPVPFLNSHFTQTGTGAVDETLDAMYRNKIFYPEMFSDTAGVAVCGAADAGPAIQRAINAAGALAFGPGTVQLAPCAYNVVTPVIDPYGVRLLGSNISGTLFVFAPASNNQIAYRVRNAGLIVSNGSMENIFFYTNDTTRTKVAIEIEDVSHYTFKKIRIGGATVGLANLWGGAGSSIGVRTRGREFIHLDGVESNADIPFEIAKNPNSTIDLDVSDFRNINGVASDGNNGLLIDTGLALTRNNFTNVHMSGGTNCLFWINVAGTLPSDGNTFENWGCEQPGTGATGYNYVIEGNATGLIRNLTLSGYHLLDPFRNGPIFRNIRDLNIAGTVFYQGVSPLFCMDVDNSVRGMSWRNSLFQVCSTTAFLGQTKIAGAKLNTGQVLPNWAMYASTLDSAILDGASGAFADSANSPLVLNSTTGVLTCPTCATSSGGGAVTGTSPIVVSAGGVVSFAPAGTSNGVLYNSAGTLGNTAAGTNGQVFLGVTGSAPAWGTMSGDATISNSGILTLTTAQPAVHTWALAQTFTVAPIFTDQSGSRTALGLGTIATQAAGAVAITGGTIAGLTGLAIRDTSAAFDLTIAATSSAALSAARTLTLNMGNVAHTLAFGTTANTITFPNLASFTVITNGDTGTVTNAMLAGSIAASKLVGTDIATVGTLTAGTASTGFVLGGVTVTLGSDATGDIHYRNSSGVFTRLGIGSSGNVLTVAGGLPSWAAPAAAAAGSLTGSTLAAGVTASSLTSVGTIATGVWQGTVVGSTYGGTGINNGSSTITLAGNLTTSGAFATTITSTATTNSTLPSGTHTLAGLDVAQTFTASQTISVASSLQLTLRSSGSNSSFMNIDTGAAAQQSGFNLYENGVLAWQFIKQSTSQQFLIFDSANGISSLAINPGTTTVGSAAFGYTKAATTKTSASVTIAGGLGVAGAIFTDTINVITMQQTSAAQSGTVCYASATGLVTYDATLGCLASTLEVKDDWTDFDPDRALTEVVQMRPGSFTYKPQMGLPDGEQVGFNAQQMEKVDPRLVAYAPDGKLLGVRYQQSSALYAAAIRALKNRLDTLEDRK